MEKIRVDIPGLDLILGGGIPAIRRVGDAPPSATLLLRGPPGSGKTVLGTQLAGAIARELGCDVACACVGVSPVELAEQHASFGRAGERVVVGPFAKEAASTAECRIFAKALDLSEPGNERAAFGPAVLALLDGIAKAGGVPRVLVIDALSDGYGLGLSAPRKLVDDLVRAAAERGVFLVLIEESLDGRPSSWSFAADIVFGLEVPAEDLPDAPAPFDRRITVVKNRFAPSDAGPHRFTILSKRGVMLFPRPSAYLASWAPSVVLPESSKGTDPGQGWAVPLDNEVAWPRFRECVTAVYGSDAALVRETASKLGGAGGVDVFVDFGRSPDARHKPRENEVMFPGGHPFLSGNHLIAGVVRTLEELQGTYRQRVRRVLIGDLRCIRTFWSPGEIRRALGVLVAILRRVGVPAVLFETTAALTANASWALVRSGLRSGDPSPTAEDPTIADVADVLVEVAPAVNGALAIMTDVRGGRRQEWPIAPLKA